MQRKIEAERDGNKEMKRDKGSQWRNSYGLRVGKPVGARAEGAPAGCPFTLVIFVPAESTLSQRCPFPTLFLS